MQIYYRFALLENYYMKTTNGKRGGNLVGKPHNDKSGNPVGGIKAQVTDAGGKPVELEGGEVIINKEASKKYWKELSKINQSAGNGVPIERPVDPHDEDPSEYEEGDKIIEFNRNHLPNKWILTYAKNIKTNHPEIWKLGGNIYGNTAFENLSRVAERGYWLDSEEWMYKKWQSFLARHQHDFRIAGVVAVLKWGGKVNKGWAYMKNLIEDKINKSKAKPKSMRDGGSVEFKPEKKGTLIKGSEIIKYAEKVNGNYRLVFYSIKESKGKVPTLCDAFDYCKKIDTSNVTPNELIDLIEKNNLMEQGGKLMKRADGSYSQRGLWDNIRDNAGSGKKPTKQMLEQEAKIKAESMRDGGKVKTDFYELDDKELSQALITFWNDFQNKQGKYLNILKDDYTLDSERNLLVFFRKKEFTKIERFNFALWIQPYLSLDSKPFIAKYIKGYTIRGNRIFITIESSVKFEDGGIAGDIYSLKDREQFTQIMTIYNDLTDKFAVKNYFIDNKNNSVIFILDGRVNEIKKNAIVNYLQKKSFDIIDTNSIEWGVDKTSDYFKLKVKGILKYADGGSVGFEDKLFTELADHDAPSFADGGKVKKANKGGDCYQAAGNIVIDSRFLKNKFDFIGTPYLVHAEVTGQGAISGIQYGHAWVEDDAMVYDYSNNRQLVIPKVIYYAIGNIKTNNPKKYIKYTFEEARRKMSETGDYGHWDLDVQFKEGGEVENEFENTMKLIDEIKKHSFYTKGTISTAKDGSKYRYDNYKLKYPNTANWLVQLFEKASEENTGKSYHTQFNHTDKYSFSYDRARFKGMPHGKMSFKVLVLM